MLKEFHESFMQAMMETYTFIPSIRKFRNDNSEQRYGTYGNKTTVYLDSDTRHFNIVSKVLSPANNKLKNTADKRYIVQCTNNNMFFVPDSYLQKNDLFHTDTDGNFIALNTDQIVKLLSTFSTRNRLGQLVYTNPDDDLHFDSANDFAHIIKNR